MNTLIKVLFLIAGIFLGMVGYHYRQHYVLPEWLQLSNIRDVFSIISPIVGIVFGGLAYSIYRKQAALSDTSNLMTTWCEHNTIIQSVNDPTNADIKPLKYFELIMFFEKICGLYYTEWKHSYHIKKEFHVLYDETIEANCRKYFKEVFVFIYLTYGKCIYEYGLGNLTRYLHELDDPTNAESIQRRKKIIHMLHKPPFSVEKVLQELLTLYQSKPTKEFNINYFSKYQTDIKKIQKLDMNAYFIKGKF